MHYSSCKIRTSYAQRVPVVSSHSVVLTWMGAPVPRECRGKTPLRRQNPATVRYWKGCTLIFILGRCLVLPNILWNLVGSVGPGLDVCVRAVAPPLAPAGSGLVSQSGGKFLLLEFWVPLQVPK